MSVVMWCGVVWCGVVWYDVVSTILCSLRYVHSFVFLWRMDGVSSVCEEQNEGSLCKRSKNFEALYAFPNQWVGTDFAVHCTSSKSPR